MDIPGTIPSPGRVSGVEEGAPPHGDVHGRSRLGEDGPDGLGRKFSRVQDLDGHELDSDLEDDALDASYLRGSSGPLDDDGDEDDDVDSGIDAEFEADLARAGSRTAAGLDAAAFLSGMYGSSVDDDGIMREVEEMYVRERARAREAAFHGGRGVAAGSDEEE